MEPKFLTLEGTAEEIRAQLPDAPGKRLRVTALILEPETQERAEASEEADDTLETSITEQIIAIFKDVPPEEKAKVPPDLLDNLDHYIYGWPKK